MNLKTLRQIRIGICRCLEWVLILAVFILVMDVLWGVVTRCSGTLVSKLEAKDMAVWGFLPRGQDKFSEEIARFLLVWISLLGGAVAFGEKAHLGVDYFVEKFDRAPKRFATLFGHAIVLFFAISVFIIGGLSISLNNMEQMAPALGPQIGLMMGHVYMALPIAGFFIILFTLEQILETWLGLDDDKEAQ